MLRRRCEDQSPDPARHLFQLAHRQSCLCGRFVMVDRKVRDTYEDMPRVRVTGGRALPLPSLIKETAMPHSPRARVLERRDMLQNQLAKTIDTSDSDSLRGQIQALDWVLTVI